MEIKLAVNMAMELAQSMLLFGKIFFGAAVLAGVAAFSAHMRNRGAAELGVRLGLNNKVMGIVLWVLAWLIS